MKKALILTLSVSAMTVLAGCNGSTDPATAGLFDNIQHLNSGEYDRQIAAKEAEAAAITRANQAAEANISSLKAQRAVNASAIASLRGQIANVSAQIASAKARAASDPAKLAKLNGLQAQVQQVNADASAGGDPAALRAELRRISAAVRTLSS